MPCRRLSKHRHRHRHSCHRTTLHQDMIWTSILYSSTPHSRTPHSRTLHKQNPRLPLPRDLYLIKMIWYDMMLSLHSNNNDLDHGNRPWPWFQTVGPTHSSSSVHTEIRIFFTLKYFTKIFVVCSMNRIHIQIQIRPISILIHFISKKLRNFFLQKKKLYERNRRHFRFIDFMISLRYFFDFNFHLKFSFTSD